MKTVKLTPGEQQCLVGLLAFASEQNPDGAEEFNALSDKIMSEKEAAKILQDLGFQIVEKGTNKKVRL